MKQFKVTMLIPHERIIKAADVQGAHNAVTAMLSDSKVSSDPYTPAPVLHSIVELEETLIDYDDWPSPAA